MVHRVVFRVGSDEALDFWEQRVGGERSDGSLVFNDPEGLELELVIDDTGDEPLVARSPEIPEEHALRGFHAVRAYSSDPARSDAFLRALSFEDTYEARGDLRGGFYKYDDAPGAGVPGAGTVHHVAWAIPLGDQEQWRTRVAEAGGRPTPVIDRYYFRSIYFREPSGVLFELATMGPGFATDEDKEHLGERLSLPPAFEHLRERVEPLLTPLPNPRERVR
jgi:glyoxalase family protein